MTARHTFESTDDGTILDGEHHVLELIATGAGLHDVLDALCRVIDEQSGLRSSIFRLDSSGERLTLAAAPNVPEAWRHATSSFAAVPTNTSCGAAVSSRGQVIVTDVAA